MAAPAFGFSVGDFVAAVNLAIDVSKALRDAGGASDEYRLVISELELLRQVLNTVQFKLTQDNSHAKDLIEQQLNLTSAGLSDFLKSIEKFHTKLGPQASPGWHRGASRKVQWALKYRKSVEELRGHVGSQLQALILLLLSDRGTSAGARPSHYTSAQKESIIQGEEIRQENVETGRALHDQKGACSPETSSASGPSERRMQAEPGAQLQVTQNSAETARESSKLIGDVGIGSPHQYINWAEFDGDASIEGRAVSKLSLRKRRGVFVPAICDTTFDGDVPDHISCRFHNASLSDASQVLDGWDRGSQLLADGNSVLRRNATQAFPDVTNDIGVLATLLIIAVLQRIRDFAQRIWRFICQRTQVPSIEPASPFIWPEAYTNPQSTPRLLSHSEYLESASEHTQVNRYGIFYSRLPRQWMRFSVSVTIGSESKLWGLEHVKKGPVGDGTFGSYGVPTTVRSVLTTYLDRHADLEEDRHFKIYLGSPSSKTAVTVHKPLFDVREYMKRKTNLLSHMGCRQISETGLDQRPLHRPSRNCLFTTCFESRWVLDYRFGSDKEEIDGLWYMLKALYCLGGAAGINPLIGVTVDRRGGMHSVLAELPTGGRLISRLHQPIALERRERWCRQIVEGVAHAHSHGFTVGCLGMIMKCGISIDHRDNAVLCHFRPEFRFGKSRPGSLPPEYRHLGLVEGSMQASYHSDIFHLGFLLWLIARNDPSNTRSVFCRISGCRATRNDLCSHPHADPIQLPSLRQAPAYLQGIISACRAENPYRRATAREILDMFPRAVEGGALDKAAPVINHPRYLTRPEECLELYANKTSCDICGRPTTERFFHCSKCESGNFDICPQCIDQGAHCPDKSHYLRENITVSEERKYYSSVNETGSRTIISV